MNKLFFILFAFFSACTISNSDKSKLENEARIIILQKSDSLNTAFEKIFPDSLNLSVREVSNTSGSYSSLFIVFSDTIGEISYKLSINLPAGEKFAIRNKNDGSLEFVTDDIPCTILGKEYKPFNNVLDNSPNEVHATLERFHIKNREFYYIDFSLKKLTLYSIKDKDGKLNAHFDFSGTSQKYDAEISIDISKKAINKILVD